MPDPTSILKVIPQRYQFDCGVACLAMLLGKDYEETLLAFRGDYPLVSGVTIRQLKKAAQRLGQSIQKRRKITLDEDAGILALGSTQWRTDHLVVLMNELIVDPEDATLWDADVYLAVNQATPLCLFVRK